MQSRSDEREPDHTMSRITTSEMARTLSEWRAGGRKKIVAVAAAWLAVVAVAALVGVAIAQNRTLGLALAALVLVLGVFVADPILLVVLVLPGSLLVQRLGGGSTNLSVADLLVFMGGAVCLFHIKWKEAPFLRQFLQGIIWYEAALILVVIAHPNRYNIVDWFHRFSYLAGSVLVGWVIVTHGRTRQAFRLYLLGTSVLAVLAMEHAVSLHFQAAQWGVYQKNTVGGIMWVSIVVAQINPSWLGVGRLEARVSKYLCIGGLLASQSRQAGILLILAIVVAVFLNPEVRRRSKLTLLGAIPLVVVLYYSFALAARNNPKFNSVSIRESQISAALHVWHLSPLLGEGMRFYNLPQYLSVTAPPNVVIDNLASTGVVGSIAFCFLVFITMRTLLRLPFAFGTLGLVVLGCHYVDGLFDIFWIGAPSITAFIIAGVSLGKADLERRKEGRSLIDVALVTAESPGKASSGGGTRPLRAARWSARAASAKRGGAMARFIPVSHLR
jgi:hypothetical protein